MSSKVLRTVLWFPSLVALLALGCDASPGRRMIGSIDADVGDDADPGGMDAGVPTDEVCDNGVDDNRDGVIDERCSCTEGARQACWPGPASRRGVGLCRDGVQVCEPFGEFMAWGPCTNAQLPEGEIEGNGLDEDCDGTDPGGSCTANEFGEGCAGGADDDCDGLTDCDDPDCASAAGCSGTCTPDEFGELCGDRIDNDCDGAADCLDTDCATADVCSDRPDPDPGCRPEFPFFVELLCGDGRDNDCDGAIDCDDSDCRRPGSCGCDGSETACTDGGDNDCDRSTDCADTDCQRCAPGSRRWCDDPMYCHWGQQECLPDGHWGTCIETTDRPMGCDTTIYSTTCCVDAGECCQNYPTDDSSVGDCDTVVTCR